MKIVLETVEISDEERVKLANVLDGKVSKRMATRKEARDYVWECGRDWPTFLSDAWRDAFDSDASVDEEDEDDSEDIDLEDLL